LGDRGKEDEGKDGETDSSGLYESIQEKDNRQKQQQQQWDQGWLAYLLACLPVSSLWVRWGCVDRWELSVVCERKWRVSGEEGCTRGEGDIADCRGVTSRVLSVQAGGDGAIYNDAMFVMGQMLCVGGREVRLSEGFLFKIRSRQRKWGM